VFLSNLRPSPARAPAAGDICPLTGRARLSYRRAAELLVAQTGWTLHQFRHSALTHLAEDNVESDGFAWPQRDGDSILTGTPRR